MLGKNYSTQNCSIARTLEFVGERWSLLIVRDALFGGVTRFGDFQRSLGIATNVLASRLESFVEVGLMERLVGDDPARTPEYVLTEKGRALQPVILALAGWGDRYAAPDGPPILFSHDACGEPVQARVTCPRCGDVHDPVVRARFGPGAPGQPVGAPVVPGEPVTEP